MFSTKNTQYDDSFAAAGAVGVVSNINAISKRLNKIVIKDGEYTKEGLIAELAKDLVNYSVMLLICMDDDNWDGVEE